jgi:O-antigen/teichoic acid export membrane protein
VSSIALTFFLLRLIKLKDVYVYVIILYSLALLPHSLYTSLLAVFNAQERMGTTGVLQVVASGIQLFLGIVILQWAPDVILLALSLPVAMGTASALGLFILGRSGVPSLKLKLDTSRKLLQVAWPFMVINLLTYAFQKADVLLLSMMRGDAEVGWYGAAYNFVDAIMFLPMAYTAAIFPRLSRLMHHEREDLDVILHRSLRHLFSLGCFFAATLAVFANQLILWVYKAAFVNSVTLLRILVLGLIPMFPNSLFGYVLFSRGKQKELVKLFVFNLSVNILLNSLAIPRYGALGAAVTMLISLLLSFFCLVYIINRNLFKIRVFRECIKPIIISIIYFFFLVFLYSWNAVLSLIVSIPIYLLLYWISGILGSEEKCIIQSLCLNLYQGLALLFRPRARNAD